MASRKKSSSPKKSSPLRGLGSKSNIISGLLGLALIVGGTFWFYGEEIGGLSKVGTAYGARTACSCRYISGRELGSCGDDFPSGMGLVFLSEDEDDQTVTASIPLIASTTAYHREGFGCVLEKWEG